MGRSAEIDNSLKERRDILELLERLKREEVSFQELEQIGVTLRQAGGRALRPLVRQLARENSGELITRYAYLLDFFEPENWLDQLIRIAMKRRDLSEDGRAALWVVLEGYGVQLQTLLGKSARPSLMQLLQGGMLESEEALATFLDDFLGAPCELQQSVMNQLAAGGEPQQVRLLEAMLWHQEKEIVHGALTALGRARQPLAAQVLELYLENGAEENFPLAKRSLRRLAFLGIHPGEATRALPFHAAYATAPDGDGYRALLIARFSSEDKLAVLYMQVHEERGLLAAWGTGELTREAFETELERFCLHEDLLRVAPGHVMELLRDALHHSTDLSYLPADFYLRRGMFYGEELTPKPYRPRCQELAGRGRLTYSEGEEISRELFAEHFFAGNFLPEQRLNELVRECGGVADGEQLLARFCGRLDGEEVEQIRERFWSHVDFMLQAGKSRRLVYSAASLAESLAANPLPNHQHPFLRALAKESIEWVQTGLAPGEEGRRPIAEEP